MRFGILPTPSAGSSLVDIHSIIFRNLTAPQCVQRSHLSPVLTFSIHMPDMMDKVPARMSGCVLLIEVWVIFLCSISCLLTRMLFHRVKLPLLKIHSADMSLSNWSGLKRMNCAFCNSLASRVMTLTENCVIPILDLLPIEGFWFAVMPVSSMYSFSSSTCSPYPRRWGCIVHLPQPSRLHEVITMMHSILKVGLNIDFLNTLSSQTEFKGLAFLHANGIAHPVRIIASLNTLCLIMFKDIILRNVLVDHFTDMGQLLNGNSTREQLRSNGCLLYALFDFDHSVLLPPGVKKGELRLPY